MVDYYYRPGAPALRNPGAIPRPGSPQNFFSRISAVNALLAVIVIVFILQQVLPGFTKTFYLDPSNLQWWMPISSIFLHAGILHIMFNAYALWMFGPLLEQRLGRMRFLVLFFLGGIAGSALYMLTILSGLAPAMPALGASGALYAVLGAMAVLMPELVVLLLGIIPLSMRQAALLWVALELVGTFDPASGIASAAHLGGLFLGFGWGWLEAANARAEWRAKMR
ncbi:MAG: rhomboid family intramembrane serine protease [Candidatus Marsarchaeota archaeon]|nr:rhomboid family intramembrane serine protease [Candidatus Marsarchaeota archaeon]